MLCKLVVYFKKGKGDAFNLAKYLKLEIGLIYSVTIYGQILDLYLVKYYDIYLNAPIANCFILKYNCEEGNFISFTFPYVYFGKLVYLPTTFHSTLFSSLVTTYASLGVVK